MTSNLTAGDEAGERAERLRRHGAKTLDELMAELDRMTAERDELVQKFGNEAYDHAACLSIAEAVPGWQEYKPTRVAGHAVRKLRLDYDTALADLKRVEAERDTLSEALKMEQWQDSESRDSLERAYDEAIASRNAWAEKCERLRLSVRSMLARFAHERTCAAITSPSTLSRCNCELREYAEALAATDLSPKPENIDTSAGHVDAAATEVKGRVVLGAPAPVAPEDFVPPYTEVKP